MATRSAVETPSIRRFDVSGTAGLPGSLSVASWVFEPTAATPRGVLLAVPGGSYGKSYWHLPVPGYAGYSFAEFMTRAGYVVVAVDSLGTGDSSRPADGNAVNLDVIAEANDAVARQLRQSYAGLTLVGVGHSMGAGSSIVAQALHRSFDALALLGHGLLPFAGLPDTLDESVLMSEIEQLHDASPATRDDGHGYYIAQREHLRAMFHLPDVPEPVVAADAAAATVVPRGALHQASARPLGRALAAMIDVPILHAWGSADTSPNPHDEGRYFSSCHDYTLVMVPDSAHCHNFAGTRHLLWRRIATWLDSIETEREQP
jgi:hypothetical protein